MKLRNRAVNNMAREKRNTIERWRDRPTGYPK